MKRLFIAVILSLYNPETLTGVHEARVKGGLCEELSALLDVKREWISEQAAVIRKLLNPVKTLGVYQAYKREVECIAGVLKVNIS